MLASRQAAWAPRLTAAALNSLLALSPALLRTLTTRQSDADAAAIKDRRYVDRLKIAVRAGRGGNGCISFYQGASRGRSAIADGGNGGEGGSVLVRAASSMKSLAGVQQLYKGEPGLHGSKQRQHGQAGRDAVVLVPVGTVVQRLRLPGEPPVGSGRREAGAQRGAGKRQAGEGEEGQELPAWVRRWRRPFTGADSGSGGDEEDGGAAASGQLPSWWDDAEGGAASATARGSPLLEGQQYEQLADLTEHGQESGQEGESCRLLLELKLLADVGLVGPPNAGKSTLLRALTAARPRVAAFPFTTLHPQLGVLAPPSPAEDPIVVADIPGLVEGAHRNRGLGHHFLRHVERTKAIVYVLDGQAGTGGRPGHKPWRQLRLLQRELAAYSPRLASLPAMVLANKLDAPGEAPRPLAALRKRTDLPVVGLSALQHATLEPAGGPLAPGGGGATPAPPPKAGPRLVWSGGLHTLAFRLAQLLHEAGARREAPVWAEYAAAAAAPRGHPPTRPQAGLA